MNQKRGNSIGKKSLDKDASLGYRAWKSLADAYRGMYSHVMSDLRQHGLTPPQYSVLRAVGLSDNSLPMNKIADELVVSYANVTMIVDNLEKIGYAKRVRIPEDRRVVRVELTDSGMKLFKTIREAHRGRIESLIDVALTEAELKSLISVTSKLKSAVSSRNSQEGKSNKASIAKLKLKRS